MGFLRVSSVVLLAGLAIPAAVPTAAPSASEGVLHVGLRRSSYGLPRRNADHAWWAQRARSFATNFPGAKPAVIEIVSTYQDGTGGTEFEFDRPADFAGVTDGMTFSRGRLDHEKALAEYDAQGVEAILQVEPGSADMLGCLEIVHRKFGGHPCVVGFGLDAEWYHTKGSAKGAGRPITDAEAKAWMEKTLSLNPRSVLFLKHWDASHMPPTYRHPRMFLISDSQDFKSRDEFTDDFKGWARRLKGATVGYQFGYPKDKRWWSLLKNPPVELGKQLLADIPDCRWLFWVDFTADQIEFK